MMRNSGTCTRAVPKLLRKEKSTRKRYKYAEGAENIHD